MSSKKDKIIAGFARLPAIEQCKHGQPRSPYTPWAFGCVSCWNDLIDLTRNLRNPPSNEHQFEYDGTIDFPPYAGEDVDL